MSKPKIAVIDTGCANLSSVVVAPRKLDVDPVVTASADEIRAADRLILPGVGTACAAMEKIRERELEELIVNARQPLLGICLGMQLLCASSSESALGEARQIPCLNVVEGTVSHMAQGDLRLPHMGWDQIEIMRDHPLFAGIPSGTYFYFVHSYAMNISPATAAACTYGSRFTAVAVQGNFMGTQFHPEKSGAAGARLLKNFTEMQL